MNKAIRTILACATFAASTLPLGASAADDASTTMSSAEIPCSRAAVMMAGGMHGDAMHGDSMKGDAMKGDAMKGDAAVSVDAAYAAGVAMRAKEMMAMAKLEMRCGSDPKAKSAAEKSLPDLQRLFSTLSIF